MGRPPRLLVTPEEFDTLETPLVIDTRAAETFAKGQIPGSVHLDLWGVSLIDTSPAPLAAFMWMIGHLFAARGVTPNRPVVVYDDHSGIRAARAFWFLETLGHAHVHVLDGGFPAWWRAGRPVSTGPVAPVPSTWHGEVSPATLATWEDVLACVKSSSAAVVDTRSDDEYYGRVARAKRGGAIPGAVHVEWTRNLSSDGTYLPPDELRAIYFGAGVTGDREVITYCQGGYRAAHTYLALRLLDMPNVRVYTGSWKEWGDRADLPIEHPHARIK